MWEQGSLEYDRYGSGWCEEGKGQAKPGEPLYICLCGNCARASGEVRWRRVTSK
jgi:hypothetical protein